MPRNPEAMADQYPHTCTHKSFFSPKPIRYFYNYKNCHYQSSLLSVTAFFTILTNFFSLLYIITSRGWCTLILRTSLCTSYSVYITTTKKNLDHPLVVPKQTHYGHTRAWSLHSPVMHTYFELSIRCHLLYCFGNIWINALYIFPSDRTDKELEHTKLFAPILHSLMEKDHRSPRWNLSLPN